MLLVVGLATPAAVNAVSKTVRYKGVAVYWEYGRTLSQLWSYSQVGTHRFKKRQEQMERLPAGKKLVPRMLMLKNLLELAQQDVIGIVNN